MWCVIPAAGSGRRFGGELPKQYQLLMGQPVLAWTLSRLASHPAVDGLVVVIAAGDGWWPGWTEVAGKPVRTAIGGEERSHSVLAGLHTLADVADAGPWVMVHDAARPCVRPADLDALVAHGTADPVGAILAGRCRDTMKEADGEGRITATLARGRLWRAFTPQLARRERLQIALETCGHRGVVPTDEAEALETIGEFPILVEGYEDNLKITSPSDMALAEGILRAQGASVIVS